MTMCARGKVLLLELKFVDALPKRITDRPYDLGLTAEQRIWLEAWYQAEGRSGVLVGVEDGRCFYVGWRIARDPWTWGNLETMVTWLRWKGVGQEPKLSLLPKLLATGALDAHSALPAVL